MKKIFLVLTLFLLTFMFTSCDDNEKLSIIAPSGAPAVAIADIAYNDAKVYDITINQTPQVLQSSFLAADTDIIIAPINMGATMYNKNGNYVLASMLTWGNLFFASQKSDFTLESLNNSDVIFFGQNTINQYIIETVLTSNSITPSNITYLSDTKITQAELLSNSNAICLVAEPSLSAAKAKNSNITAISVQDLYAQISGGNSYPQAGCFVKKATIDKNKAEVNSFISKLEASANKTKTELELIAGFAEKLQVGGTKAVLMNAIPNSNITFKSAVDSRAQIEALFKDALSYCGGKLPDDGFYYQK